MKGLFTRLSMALLWAHLINIAHSSHALHLLKFNREFRIAQGSKNNVHISGDGSMATLMLNKKADVGAEVVSHEHFLFRRFDVKIKLLPDEQGRFTGAAASYYLITTSGNHDEIRYDFSSNENGQGYMLGTNIVINGNRDREISFSFEFDPTKDYHTYSIIWNLYHVVFEVDGRTVREFKNNELLVDFNHMNLAASVHKDDGETDNKDPSKIPSSATFKDVTIDASEWTGTIIINADNHSVSGETKWWNDPKNEQLTSQEVEDMKIFREKHLVYDYCQDREMFGGNMPKECSNPN